MTNTTIRFATHLVTSSQYNKVEATTNPCVPPVKITVIYHGLDATRYCFCGTKERLAITVGDVDRCSIWRKGILPFVRAASLLPELSFVVIGEWKDDAIDLLRAEATANVCFTGRLSDKELTNWLQRASVYVQASLHEGFGLAVAEAMLCGCIPVVTRAGALPEVIGDTGIYVLSQETQALADGMRRALLLDRSWRARARARIAHKFPLSRRAELLSHVLQDVLDGGIA